MEDANFEKQEELAALNKENCQEHPRSSFAGNSIVSRLQVVYTTQVSEGMGGSVTEKFLKKFSGTEVCISRLDNFLMNPLFQGRSGTAPETCRNANGTNQGLNEDDFRSDSHPEAIFPRSGTTKNSGPEHGHHMVRGVHKEVT